MSIRKQDGFGRTTLRLTALALGCLTSAIASARSGDLNKHFGTAGTAEISAALSTGQSERVAVDHAGRVLVGYNVWPTAAAISALDPTGHVDASFGTAGILTLGDFKDLKVDSKNRYVVLGHVAAGGTGVEVSRFESNGTLDPSFGSAGVAVVTSASTADGASLGLDNDDNIIVLGADSSRAGTIFAARVTNDGLLDTSFGMHGLRQIAVTASSTVMPQAIAVDHSGNVYATSYSYETSSTVINHVVKLDANGALDKRFNGTGILTTDISPSASPHYTFAQSLAIDAKGNAVIAGGAGSWTAAKMFVARITSHGAFDPSFNTGVPQLFDIGASTIAQAQSTLIDKRGRIVLTGVGDFGGPERAYFLAARLRKDGSLDHTFENAALPTAGWKGAGALAESGNVLIVGESMTADAMLVDELKGDSGPATLDDSSPQTDDQSDSINE